MATSAKGRSRRSRCTWPAAISLALMGEMKERMLRGELYRADDPDLLEDFLRGRRLVERFNATSDDDEDERRRLLERLLGRFGAGSQIRAPFQCDYGYLTVVGERTFINYGTAILDCAKVTIGDDTVVGAGAIVTRDLPSGVVAVGNPARVLRPIGEQDRVGVPDL